MLLFCNCSACCLGWRHTWWLFYLLCALVRACFDQEPLFLGSFNNKSQIRSIRINAYCTWKNLPHAVLAPLLLANCRANWPVLFLGGKKLWKSPDNVTLLKRAVLQIRVPSLSAMTDWTFLSDKEKKGEKWRGQKSFQALLSCYSLLGILLISMKINFLSFQFCKVN